MTNEQSRIFADVASMGVACGLETIDEWYGNFMLHTMNLIPYAEIPQREAEVADAFHAFFKESTSGPGDIVYDLMTTPEFDASMMRPLNKKFAEMK